MSLVAAPPPVRGGTFVYCPWREKVPGGVTACGVPRVGRAAGTRFRTPRAYRRHWRRFHA